MNNERTMIWTKVTVGLGTTKYLPRMYQGTYQGEKKEKKVSSWIVYYMNRQVCVCVLGLVMMAKVDTRSVCICMNDDSNTRPWITLARGSRWSGHSIHSERTTTRTHVNSWIQFVLVFLLPFHSTILEPYLNLSLTQTKCMGNFNSTPSS